MKTEIHVSPEHRELVDDARSWLHDRDARRPRCSRNMYCVNAGDVTLGLYKTRRDAEDWIDTVRMNQRYGTSTIRTPASDLVILPPVR